MAKRKQKRNWQPFWRFLFVIYAGLMLWLLFGRSSGWVENLTYRQMLQQNINITPFYTIDNYVNVLLHYPNAKIYNHCLINLVGNVVMFIPAGWLLPRIFQKMHNFLLFLMSSVFGILLIEIIQLLTLLGSFDIDDIILNLVGLLVGYIIHCCSHKK